MTETETQQLLDKLCVELGFCLPPLEQQRLVDNPPSEVLAYTDAVFRAEGLAPETAARHLYRQVPNMVGVG